MIWPTPYEYDQALLNRLNTFSNPLIQHGRLEEEMQEPKRLNDGGCRYVCVYKVGSLVVRCFAADPTEHIGPPRDIIQRYQGITAYLRGLNPGLPFLVDNHWNTVGVNVKGNRVPYLELPYVDNSMTLGDFLSNHGTKPQVAGKLAQQWLKIIQQLESKQIAHGDLDISNVLVSGSPSSPELHLVDFDGMYVSTFANKGMQLVDDGHPDFQPPATLGIRRFGPEMDRFSALVIYLSLCALAQSPSLWLACAASDRNLLLGAADFANLGLSQNFARLRREHNNQELQECLNELETAIQQPRMPRSLIDILKGYVPVVSPEPDIYRGLAVPLPVGTNIPSNVIPTSNIDDGSGYTPPRPAVPVGNTSFQAPPTQPAYGTNYTSPPPPNYQTLPRYQPPSNHTKRNIIIAIVIIIIIAAIIIAWAVIQANPQQQQMMPGFVFISQLVFVLPMKGIVQENSIETIQEKQYDEKI